MRIRGRTKPKSTRTRIIKWKKYYVIAATRVRISFL
jgi:hypothetical protein